MKKNGALGVYNALINAKLTKMGDDWKIKEVKYKASFHCHNASWRIWK